MEDRQVGRFINEQCPKCGSGLLGNLDGEKWCSFVMCNYGLEDLPEPEIPHCSWCERTPRNLSEQLHMFQWGTCEDSDCNESDELII